MLWHFDELSEFARSGHGGFNATSDRGQIRPLRHVGVESVLSPTSDIDRRGRYGRKVPGSDICSATDLHRSPQPFWPLVSCRRCKVGAP